MPARSRTSKAGSKVPGLDAVCDANQAFVIEMLNKQIDPETLASYERMHKRIVEVGGDDELEGVLTFLRTEDGLAAVTKRYYKSGLLFIRDRDGRPVDPTTAALYDRVLRGMEVTEGRRVQRGAMTAEQFGDLLDHAKAYIDDDDLAEGYNAPGRSHVHKLFEWLHVQFGLAARGPSTMPRIEAGHVDLRTKTVLLHRKCTAIERLSGAEHTAVPIWTHECFNFLAARKKEIHDEGLPLSTRLYPDWKAEVVTDAVQHVAEACNWPRNVRWTGSHNIRHAAAMQALEDALEEVRTRAGWQSEKMVRHYSIIRREEG